jgi:hypothetical protein
MDLSKLPRLSGKESQAEESTVAPAPASEAAPAVPPPQTRTIEPMAVRGPEAWISIGVGAFVLLVYPRFLQWASSRLFHTRFDEFMLDDKVVPYQSVPEFWMDLGSTLFGIILIINGITLLTARHRGVLAIALGLTVPATAYNLIYMIMTFNDYGFAPVSFLATIFGAYIAWYQWGLLRGTRGRWGYAPR